MTMKLTQFRTYWTAEEAESMISFLDELKDALWAVYGNAIIEMHHAECSGNAEQNSLEGCDFEDDLDF